MRSVAFAGDDKSLAGHKQLAYRHFTEGESAGLVGADHIRGAKRFDGGEFAYECPVPRHAHDAECEGHGHYRRHTFRHGSHGKADRCHEHLQQTRAAQQTQQEQKRDDAKCHPDEHAPE